MKISEFRKLIREEVRKVLGERVPSNIKVKVSRPTTYKGKYYFAYFHDNDAIVGDPINTRKELLYAGMDDDDPKRVGPVYETKVDSYTIYVITDKTDKKSIWCVASPGDAKFAGDYGYRYKTCMKAIADARSGKGVQMTFADFLKEP